MNCLQIGLAVLLSGFTFIGVSADVPYPLDPLTPEEIEYTAAIVRATNPSILQKGNWLFNWITLKEPEKNLLLPYFLTGKSPPSHVIPRKAFVILREKRWNIVNEIVVNLSTRRVESWKVLPPGKQAAFTPEENDNCVVIAKKDPAVQERCRQMGWHNMSLVVGSCWGVGYAADRPLLANAIRPVLIYFYGQMFELDNFSAHPFDFVVAVDLGPDKVIFIDNLPSHSNYDADNRVGNICPRKSYNYNPHLLPPEFYRKDVHEIYFSQPEEAGYQISGNEVTWQKFKFRVGFNSKDGLSIHHVSFQDGLERRPLFYRMSIADLFVNYGDPRPPYHQKIPFDMGEWNLGLWGVDLKKAGVCRGGVVSYLSYAYGNEKGESVPLPNVICIYEEDDGLLWAHQTRDPGGPVYHARSQRLTVEILVNEGGYDYKFSWRFYQDARIEFNLELFGTVSAHLLAANVTNAGGFGLPIVPSINAQYHQHHCAVRIDPEIDGNSNTVSTVDVMPLPDPSGSVRNPYGNGFTTVETILKTASEARTNISPLTGRSWWVRNPSKIHPSTRKPVAWKLVPHNASPVLIRKDSPMHHRFAFADYSLWVTKYKDDQIYPYGLYVNGTGLPEWVDEDPNADVTNTDVVLWYSYGYTHIPKTEDWPTMSAEPTGFWLMPSNFFLENPGLDVPPPSI